MQIQLSHSEARGLFLAALDDELPDREGERLRAHLDGCADCRTGWERYHRTAELLGRVERERVPPALATLIMRRVRRRRLFGQRGLFQAQVYYRVPVEAIIPVLLGVLVAAFLVLIAP
ncbi:MAG: zf-HC2 domain-containing protein [Myxococcales bacterium]|nr:zf-HC2 domain-containing protein [Myxococcales bacterium]